MIALESPVHALVSPLTSFERYLESLALRPATIRNYLADARAFLRWLNSSNPAPSLHPSDFLAYRDHLADSPQSQATINRRLHTLRLYGRFLWEHGSLAQNPADGLTLVPNRIEESIVPRVLDEGEVERLRAAVLESARPSLRRRDVAVVEAMLEGGLRVAEVGQLRHQDLVLTREGLRLTAGEDGHTRQVPVTERLARALRDYMAVRPQTPDQPYLFLSQKGKPLCARGVQRLIETYARAAALTEVNAKALRHTCAFQWLSGNHDPSQVAQWLGKRHPEGLQKYRALLNSARG